MFELRSEVLISFSSTLYGFNVAIIIIYPINNETFNIHFCFLLGNV